MKYEKSKIEIIFISYLILCLYLKFDFNQEKKKNIIIYIHLKTKKYK